MRPSSKRVNIAASAQKIDVDNRISLRFYYRIADNVLKQADIFREENNIIDLYIMLLRYSSLITETIPCHRDYGLSLQSNNIIFKKRLLKALSELEQLKPTVQQKVDELNRKHTFQINGQGLLNQNGSYTSSLEWPRVTKQTFANYNVTKATQSVVREFVSQGLRTQSFSNARLMDEQFRGLSLNIMYPKEETLSRHSILGPNGLRGQWQPPRSDKGVQYPSNIDLTPVEIPSLLNPLEGGHAIKEEYSNSEHEKSSLESILTPKDDSQTCHAEEPCSLISFETMETPVLTRQPSPPPVLANVQDLIPATTPRVTEPVCGSESPSHGGFLGSESPLQLHISTAMMEGFMRVAKSNTDKNLETCGVLAGSLKNRKFYVTALIIPKQESSSDSCQTTNEEEIFEVQDKQSLFPLGWIHTHPTQSCFMSSIDVHTHYSYQIMLPEAIAIVMAPRDTSRKHGIFRLTTPEGMTAIRHCEKRGFHPHEPLPNGEPLYKQCTDVYINPNLKFDVIDLR